MSCGTGHRDKFLRDGDLLNRALVEDLKQAETAAVLRPLVSALDLMLMSEDHFRAAERRRELDMQPEAAETEFQRAVRLNDAAIKIFDNDLPAGISALRDHLASREAGDVGPYVAVFNEQARDFLADSGLNVYQTREAREILDRGNRAATEGGDTVCDLLADGVRHLSELRADRPNQNDPVAGTCAVVFALIAAAIMVYAGAPGGPSPTDPAILTPFLFCLAVAGAFTFAALSALVWV
jgi:hypothetical protein